MPTMEPGQPSTRFTLLTPLGAGGHGEVWLAQDHLLERTVALKHLSAESGLGFDALHHEARALARLNHPNIVRLHDLAEIEGETWIVLEHVSGRSLRDLLQDGPLPEVAVRSIGRQALGALAAAHAAGIIHNDVKPENILIDRAGKARLADFGIAGFSGGTLAPEEAGALFGTLGYIAPEVVQGRQPTPASDVYSLGVTLREAATGVRPPSPGHIVVAPIKRHSISRPLESVLDRATDPDPAHRFAGAAPFAAAIATAGAAPTLELRRFAARLSPPFRGRPRVPAPLAGLALAFAGVVMLVAAAKAMPGGESAGGVGEQGSPAEPTVVTPLEAAAPQPTPTAEATPVEAEPAAAASAQVEQAPAPATTQPTAEPQPSSAGVIVAGGAASVTGHIIVIPAQSSGSAVHVSEGAKPPPAGSHKQPGKSKKD